MQKKNWTWVLMGLLSAVMLTGPALARPLVVTDAEPAERGEWELETPVEYMRDGRTRNISTPFVIAYGLADDVEVNLQFGYQWESRRERGEPRERVHGLVDTLLTAHWQFMHEDERPLSMAVVGEIKLPTAPQRRELGSGETDIGLLLIGTRTFGDTGLDVNIGVTFVDWFRGSMVENELFLGTAVRHQVNDPLTLVAEIFTTSPLGRFSDGIVAINTGFRYELSERVILDGGIGTGLRSRQADLVLTAGATWFF
jgi:hypothetical protein